MRKDLITDYSRGEISPLLEGRFDLEFYKQSNSFAENIIPLDPSGFSIRPGTYYKGETKEAEDETILIPKINPDGSGYIVEMGDNYARVWDDGVLIETEADIYFQWEFEAASVFPGGSAGIVSNLRDTAKPSILGSTRGIYDFSKTITGLTVTVGATSVQLDWVEESWYSTDYNYDYTQVTMLIGSVFTIVSVPIGTTTYTFSGLTPGVLHNFYISAHLTVGVGKVIYTGISKEHLSGMTWVQDGDSLAFASQSFAPVTLYLGEYGTSNCWGIREVPFNAKVWERYEQVYAGDVRVDPDGTYKDHYYSCLVTLDGTISADKPSINPTYWSDDGLTRPAALFQFGTISGSNPGLVGIHEGRRLYANTVNDPTTVWASRTNDHLIYMLGVQDDDPWSYDLPKSSGSSPHWMVSTETGLTVGSLNGEWQLRGADLGITPSNVYIKRLTSFGSAAVGAALQGNQIYFFGNSGEDLYNYYYQDSSAAYQSTRLSLVAEHMLADDYYTDTTETTQYGGGGVKEFAYQNDPQKIFWMIKNSGQLIGMSISSTGVAWHKHTTKKGQFQSVAVIPGTDYDEVWFIVKREIDSVTKYFIEKMGDLDIHQDIGDFHLVDCGIETRGDATPDLTHLDGEEVSVSIMGRYTAFKTVASNTIDILSEYPSTAVSTSSLYFLNASTAHIGLFSEARIRTMRQSFPGTPFSMGNVVVRVYRSYGGAITNGVAPGELQYLEYPPAPENSDLSSPYAVVDINEDDLSVPAYTSLFSGEKEIDFIGDWDTNGYIWIVIDKPTPFIALGMYVDVEDGE